MLYQLPWYMFIGAPGSGKTTALVNSGLRFPLATTKDQAGGVGGGRHAQLRLVVHRRCRADRHRRPLHHPGQYHAQVDGSAWNTFLGLLKRFRPRQPINGVFVTLSVGDLLSFGGRAQAVRPGGAHPRGRTAARPGPFPVPGHHGHQVRPGGGLQRIFSTLDATQRARWGVTFDVDLAKRSAPRPRPPSEAEVPGLVNRLNEILMASAGRARRTAPLADVSLPRSSSRPSPRWWPSSRKALSATRS